MADTVILPLSPTEWTNISISSANGFVTNESHSKVKVKEAAALPNADDKEGHTMYSGPEGYYNWAGISGNNIYARALPGATDVKVAITRQ